MQNAELVGSAQEFRRLSTALGAARDRADLLPASTSDTSALLGMQARCPGLCRVCTSLHVVVMRPRVPLHCALMTR